MPKLTINGKEVEVPAGTNLIEAARIAGFEVPHYCYHPSLSIAGQCRLCMVDIEKTPRPTIGCNTVATEGMVVNTETDRVRETRKSIMEFHLINHPLDCPVCDQAGECWLQIYYMKHGLYDPRMKDEKVHKPKAVPLGPHVMLDAERCILCSRCVRYCDEITHTGELGIFERGDHSEIGLFPGRELDNKYSANVVDICPVGALTDRDFRFQVRVWYLDTAKSVCPGCARGCNVRVWHRDGAISRLTPRDNPEVNGAWMCDYGRLIGPVLAAGTRLREPQLRAAAAAAPGPVDWEPALGAAVSALRAAGGRVAAVLRADATQEATEALIRLLEAAAGGRVEVAVPVHEEGEDDDLLIRADRTPNRRGVLELLAARHPGAVELAALADRARAGALGALLVIGEDLHERSLWGEQTPALLAAVQRVIVIASHRSATTDGAHLVLPSAVFPEMDGTWVNVDGRVQRTLAAYPPPFLARPAARILSDLVAGFGMGV